MIPDLRSLGVFLTVLMRSHKSSTSDQLLLWSVRGAFPNYFCPKKKSVIVMLVLIPPPITSHPGVHGNELLISTIVVIIQKAFLVAYKEGNLDISSQASIFN